MDSKLTITISVCGGDQEITLYTDEHDTNAIKMACIEIATGTEFVACLNKEEALLLSQQLYKCF